MSNTSASAKTDDSLVSNLSHGISHKHISGIFSVSYTIFILEPEREKGNLLPISLQENTVFKEGLFISLISVGT